jgi:hypothetical protein
MNRLVEVQDRYNCWKERKLMFTEEMRSYKLAELPGNELPLHKIEEIKKLEELRSAAVKQRQDLERKI